MDKGVKIMGIPMAVKQAIANQLAAAVAGISFVRPRRVQAPGGPQLPPAEPRPTPKPR